MSAPTSPAHGTVYPSARAVSSEAECSPCHVAAGGCPLGHPACIAWNREQFEPERVLNAVEARVCELNGLNVAQSIPR
jgi:hypothetical protein